MDEFSFGAPAGKASPSSASQTYDRDALRAKRLAGATAADLAAEYGCSVSAIRTRLNRMGVVLPAAVRDARRGDNIKSWRADPANEARRHARAADQWTPKRRAEQGDLGRKAIAKRIAWCPEEYRADYRRMIRSKRIHSSEARRIIEDEIARKAAKLTPFERLLAAAQRGEVRLQERVWLPERPATHVASRTCLA